MNRIALDIDSNGRATSLREALAGSFGFSLIFVHAPPGPVRDELITRFREWAGQDEVPPLLEVRLGPGEWPHYRLQHLGLEDVEKTMVVLMGLEQFVEGDAPSPALAAFNFVRDSLPNWIPGPLVILASDEAFVTLSLSAPDLVSWRAYELSVHAAEVPKVELPPAIGLPTIEEATAEVERLSGILKGVLGRPKGYGALEAAKIRLRLGRALWTAHRYEEAEDELGKAVAVFREEGRERELANGLFARGVNAQARNEPDVARTSFDEALPLYELSGDILGKANCTMGLGDLAMYPLDLDAARSRYAEALSLYRKAENVLGAAHSTKSLGDVALLAGERDAARARYEEALSLHRKAGDVIGEGSCFMSLGLLAQRESNHETARAMYEQALRLFEGHAIPQFIGRAHQFLADIAPDEPTRQSHLDAARAAWSSIGRDDLIATLDKPNPA